MSDTPDDLPSPDEFRKKMAHVDQEFADARRYLSALCAEDNQAPHRDATADSPSRHAARSSPRGHRN
jgi:hypothetical protein